MLYLNNCLLTADGITSELKKIPIDNDNMIGAFRKKLAKIYFPQISDEQIETEIKSARFNEFPRLQFVLRKILVNKVQPGVITIPPELIDWYQPTSYTDKTFQSLNSQYGYFPGTGKAIFNTLQPLCRKMTQLVERQADDNEMAYKLMVLFCEPQDFSDLGACLTKISKSFIDISKPVQRGTAYHDVFVNILNIFPTVNDAKDIQKWRQFIHLNGLPALYFFADCQSFTSVPETLKEAKTAQLEKTYPRALEDIEFAAFCKLHLINNFGFEAGLDYILTGWPKKEKDNLPTVNIKVVDANEEYRWVKLPPHDKRALYLGNMIPGCCQFINGLGSQCVIDGTSLSDNGFYVLLKKKIKKPGESVTEKVSNLVDGDIVAQSYAWISKNGNLCLDSLEWDKERVSEAVLKTVMSNFADGVLIQYPQIKYVNVGTGSRTPGGFASKALLSEIQRKGKQYVDSRYQYCIQSGLSPQVVKILNSIPEFKELGKEAQEKIQYLSAYLDAEHLSAKTISDMSMLLETCWFNPFPPIPPIKQLDPIKQPLTAEDFKVLTFEEYQTLSDDKRQSISSFRKLLNCDSFKSFLSWLPTIPAEDLLYIGATTPSALGFTTLHMVASSDKHLKIILSSLEGEKLDVIQAKDEHEQTVLHLAADYPESLRTILNVIPEKKRLNVLTITDRLKKTVLHLTSRNPKASKVILELLPEEERLAVVQVKNHAESTPLHEATRHPETLKVILELLPEENRLAAVMLKNESENTLLHESARNPVALKVILELLPEEERLRAVQEKNYEELSILHVVVSNPETLKVILGLLPKKDHLDALQVKNNYGNTPFHLATRHPETLKAILELLPIEKRRTAVQEKNNHGETVLHRAASHPESLRAILDILPKEQARAVVQEKNIHGETVLHRVASHRESLKAILELLPEEERLRAVQEKNIHGETVLHRAASHPESLKAILELLPEEGRRAVVKEKNIHGDTILHRAASHPESLKAILELLPEEERLRAVQEKNNFGDTPFHRAASNLVSLRAILDILPKKQARAAVEEKNNHRDTVLHQAASHPESLKAILELLPEEERLRAVQEKNNFGDTPFHLAASHPESLRVILELLPKKDRFAAVMLKNDIENTLLHESARNSEALKVILELLPEEERLRAVQEKNYHKETLLHVVVSELELQESASNFEALKVILELLPEQQRRAAVQEKNMNEETVLDRAQKDPKLLSVISELLSERKAPPSHLKNLSMFADNSKGTKPAAQKRNLSMSSYNPKKREPEPKQPNLSMFADNSSPKDNSKGTEPVPQKRNSSMSPDIPKKTESAQKKPKIAPNYPKKFS